MNDPVRAGIYVEAKGYLKDVEVQARLDKKKAEVSKATSLLRQPSAEKTPKFCPPSV